MSFWKTVVHDKKTKKPYEKNFKLSINLIEDPQLGSGPWVLAIQLNLDHTKSAGYHYELAKELLELRKKDVLIIGNGNLVFKTKK